MKPGHWWRAQNNCVDHAKLMLLNDRAFRNWFNLNCLASGNRGVLPDIDTVAFKLRLSKSRAAAAIAELVAKRLYDQREDGKFVPHDWEEWQFKTDLVDPTNADRQKKFRAKAAADLRELKSLLNVSRNALRNDKRNGVTDVTVKRPEEVSKITTTTVSVERGEEARQGAVKSPQLLAYLAKT